MHNLHPRLYPLTKVTRLGPSADAIELGGELTLFLSLLPAHRHFASYSPGSTFLCSIMAGFISKAITKVAVYAYGMFTVFLYGLISIKKGTFFKQRTEKEHLELQLGEFDSTLILFSTLPYPTGGKWHDMFVHNKRIS